MNWYSRGTLVIPRDPVGFISCLKSGGAEGTRTPAPLLAKPNAISPIIAHQASGLQWRASCPETATYRCGQERHIHGDCFSLGSVTFG